MESSRDFFNREAIIIFFNLISKFLNILFMARPERNSVDYFPFYCDEGNKMFYIEETYGNDGFATFVKILRELAKTDYHYLDLSKPTTIMFLSAKCKVSKETLLSIISDLVDLGKFDSLLWIENKIIWCSDFVESIKDAYERRKNECITYEGLLQHLCSLGVRKQNKCTKNNDNNTQTILEENKVKKNKGNSIPEFNEFLKYAEENEPLVCDKSLKRKYDAWVVNGWKDGNDKKITNWKTKLLNTIPYIDKKKNNSNGPKYNNGTNIYI